MRDFKGMKRQRGRNRGGGGGKPQHNANRAFESNGPDGVKVRGSAQNVFERYQQLARDAASAGDRVLAENYLQHAEHYFRTLRAMQPNRPVAEIYGRDQYSSGFDIDFEAEPSEETETTEQTAEDGAEGEGQGGEQRQQGERPQRDRYENRDRRDDRQRDDRQRDDRQQGDRPQGEGRQGRRDRWRDRDNRNRDGDQPREQAPAAEAPAAPPAEQPQNGPVLRSQDGEVSHAPAFLGRAPEPREGAEEPAPKPRRRRAPRATAAEEA